MAYSVSEIKIAAYNRDEKPDFDANERNLFLGLSYCYDCFKAGYDKKTCEDLMKQYVDIYEHSKLREVGKSAEKI